jgi:hypothetical protein
MQRNLVILITILLSVSLQAQERLDIFTLSGSYGFPASYDSIYPGKGTETGFMSSIVAPIQLSEKSLWYNSLNYFFWGIDNDEQMSEDLMNPIRVHGFVLRTGLIRELNNGHSLQLVLAPRFMSDFNNVNSDHWQFGLISTYGKRYSPSLKMGFGFLFNQEFFGPNLVPLVDLDWKLNDKWRIVGLFPVYGKLKYQVNKSLDLGWSHFGLLTTYRLGGEAYQGDYIDRRSIDETLYARYQLFGNLFLEARAGYSFGRSYTQYASDQKVDFTLPLISIGDDREPKTASIQSGFIANLRLVYAITLDP